MRALKVDVLTLFPGILAGPLNESILKRAGEKGLLDVRVRNIRDFTEDKHRTADDSPYGGEAGMVLKPGPIFKAIEAIRAEHPGEELLTILLSPQGTLFDQRGGAAYSRRARGRGIGLPGFLRRRAPGPSALHAARGVPGHEGPRRASLREP